MPKRLDLVGQKFGRLVVLKYVNNDKCGNARWLCRCDCGNELIIVGGNLVGGYTQSCGCYRSDRISKIRRSDLIGQKFGYLIVVKDVGNNKAGRSQWLCQCKCGNEVIILGHRLISGVTKSCGCYRSEMISKRSRKNLIGQKFGKLTVAEFSYVRDEASYWLCKCNCGNECIVVCRSLTSNNTKSCGCLHKEITSKMCKARIGKDNPVYKHGLSDTKAYDNQMNSKRRANIRNQTPLDADFKKIRSIYLFCEILNQQVEDYEVDHIKPISKGGLHHQDNLQILRSDLNRRKSDKITNEYIGITLADIEREDCVDVS